ncbi:MAG: metal-dependent hydrolase [Pseudomonadota bacterium]|jgi:inner membrane protein
MPTIFTHVAIPLAAGLALGTKALSPRLVAAGAFASIAPDFDSIAFRLGIAYADQFGHRGASHSLLFALAIGLIGAACAPALRTSRGKAFAFLALCTASHPLLDALTDGGLGVALLWPWSDARHFAPWRPIAVSPIGVGFFSARGLSVLRSELLWVWLPLMGPAFLARSLRWRAGARPTIDA